MITRAFWVWLHRWAGLAMAGFLVIVGLTGSVLAFWMEINRCVTPDLYPAPRPGIALDAATLAHRAEAAAPEALANTVFFGYPGIVMVGMVPRDESAPLDFQFLHLDPFDGHELGRVNWDGRPRSKNDIMPFIYGLHMYLAASGVGDWLLGFVATLWTLDSFVAFYLTLPRGGGGRRSFLARWRTSWRVKLDGSFFRINFDLHRAVGLWLWPMLLVYAWSSVYFTFPRLYTPVTQLAFEFDPPVSLRAGTGSSRPEPMSWERALATGERLMADVAREHGFSTGPTMALYQWIDQDVYEYRIRSSLDFADRGGATSIYFDIATGELKAMKLPAGQRAGTTLTTWLVELHTANVFGLPYKIFVSLLGLCIAMLSATGVYIWWKKRYSRLRRGASRIGDPDRQSLASRALD